MSTIYINNITKIMQHLPCWWKCYISYKLIQYGKIMNIINNLWLNYRYVRYMADGSSILMEISPLLWLISWPRRSPLLHLKKLYGHNTFIQMTNISKQTLLINKLMVGVVFYSKLTCFVACHPVVELWAMNAILKAIHIVQPIEQWNVSC